MRRQPFGFTLIEVLVALVIAIIGLSILVQAGFAGLQVAALSTRYQEAVARAQSHLAAVANTTTASDLQGTEGDGYRWHVRIRPLASAALPTTPPRAETLLAVTVTVAWGKSLGNEGAAHVVQLDSERVVSSANAPGP
jgi:general secretion pathway protein I